MTGLPSSASWQDLKVTTLWSINSLLILISSKVLNPNIDHFYIRITCVKEGTSVSRKCTVMVEVIVPI